MTSNSSTESIEIDLSQYRQIIDKQSESENEPNNRFENGLEGGIENNSQN